MSWLWFGLGFLAFPTVVVLAVRFFDRARRVTPTAIEGPHDLQTVLRALLSQGRDRETLFVVWLPMGFQVRVIKRVRKSRPPTVDVELRNSGANRDFYDRAKACLEGERLEFTETFTPTKRRPSRIRLTWPDGGPFVVSAAAHAIDVLSRAVPDDAETRCAAACAPPETWSEAETASV